MTLAALGNPAVAPRPTRWLGVEAARDYLLKTYAIEGPGETFERARFADWDAAVAPALPSPARDALRPGVGFVIFHQAAIGDYLVLGRWDNRNELKLPVWVAPPGSARFAPAGERQSLCVWDLDIIIAERDAFVLATGADGLDIERYLGQPARAIQD
ncbi:hypothetical protein [Sphingomicrobium astaxanthinifaciens]|uniref:hypothetical protein n=1 Tax=Sphingomicrobium astaxanthinifaciens TaxID=1227949 RepID=UPI001FCC5C87|nr:hypothetical protein [Sphingomicrobium astaxanthinifaciens]MCJ7420684.1 hypothetical protein [Sphingomicrobium astaxanthinifaciens]